MFRLFPHFYGIVFALVLGNDPLLICRLVRTLKDTHREKAPSNKTPALRNSTGMGVWAVGTLNQLFVRGFLNCN